MPLSHIVLRAPTAQSVFAQMLLLHVPELVGKPRGSRADLSGSLPEHFPEAELLLHSLSILSGYIVGPPSILDTSARDTTRRHRSCLSRKTPEGGGGIEGVWEHGPQP